MPLSILPSITSCDNNYNNNNNKNNYNNKDYYNITNDSSNNINLFK